MKSKTKKKREWRWKLPVLRRKEASFTVVPFQFVNTSHQPERPEGMDEGSPVIQWGEIPDDGIELPSEMGRMVVTKLRNSPGLNFDFAAPPGCFIFDEAEKKRRRRRFPKI